MVLKELKIEHYRGFFEEQSIDFAIPNGEYGSGLSLIVGPNNTGKTTIIDSLRLLFNQPPTNYPVIDENEGRIEKEPKIELIVLNNTNEDSFKYGDKKSVNTICDVIPLLSNRVWSEQTNPYQNRKSIHDEAKRCRSRGTGSTLAVIDFLNNTIEKDTNKKNKFDQYMKALISDFQGWEIIFSDDKHYLNYKTNLCSHRVKFSGDGILSIFTIVSYLVELEFSSKNLILMIDEPEMYLHPQTQKKLSKIISKIASKRQVILCTHSPYFANWKDFQNGAKFIRLNKYDNKGCTISCLDNKEDYASLIKDGLPNWQKPQWFDIAAKEILFSDRILFVEGQEDVGLIRKWFRDTKKDKNFDIFGYGAGGFQKIAPLLKMASDLGLSKVAGLYDGDKDATNAYDNAKKEFPAYCIQKLPTDDIRDKEKLKPVKNKKETDQDHKNNGCAVYKIKKTVGVFGGDKNTNLKEEYAEAFEKIMNGFIQYFDTK